MGIRMGPIAGARRRAMKPECYGKIFPPVGALETNREVHGKVFGYHLVSLGMGIQGRKVDGDASQWDVCVACPEFEGCFKFSMGKLALEQVVASR